MRYIFIIINIFKLFDLALEVLFITCLYHILGIAVIKLFFQIITLLLSMIIWLTTNFSIHKVLFNILKCFWLIWKARWWRCISMPAIYRFILSILPIGKKHLTIFLISLGLYITIFRAKLVHFLIVDQKDIKIINKTRCLQKMVGEFSNKSKMTFTGSNDIFTKIYNTMIYRINTLLDGMIFDTKLSKVFSYGWSGICKDNISETKYLLFSQINTLLFSAFKKQLHISIKLVKNRSSTTISIIIHLSFIKKHDRDTIDIDIWRQVDLFIVVIKNYNFEDKIIIYFNKLVFLLVDFLKYEGLF